MKKIVLLLIVFAIGAVILSFVDDLMGIKFTGVSSWAKIVHAALYVLWGAIIYSFTRSEKEKK